MDEQRVLADEAQPGLLGVITFEHRACVDVRAPTHRTADICLQPLSQGFQAWQHEIVIVEAPGVAGDAPAFGIRRHC